MQKISFAIVALIASAAAHADKTQVQDACVVGAEPILEVADFNGDGVVSVADVDLIKDANKSGEYIAYFDRNSDGLLNDQDVAATARELGRASSMLDREIANVYWSTERFQDLGTAAANGYTAGTPVYKGHGRHWYRRSLFYKAAAYGVKPIGVINGDIRNNTNEADLLGLNYDEEGNLLAVYWGMAIPFMAQVMGPTGNPVTDFGPYVTPAPQIFSETQAWHSHLGACFIDPGFIDSLQWTQGVTADVCVARGEALRDPRGAVGYSYLHFHMLHLWINKLNPNGKFATTNPCVATDAPHEPNEGAYGHGHH